MIEYDKKILTALRAALLAVGAAVGYLSIWQYFNVYPDLVRREFQIVIAAVCSALCALFLVLSAKAFYRLGMSIKQGASSVLYSMGYRGVIAAVLAFSAAGAFVVGFDVMLRRYLDIWAVRLITDILVYIVCAVVCCYAFTAWIKSGAKKQKVKPRVGYLLGAECFADERVITAVSTLINVKVSGGAYQALGMSGDEDALDLLNSLIKIGKAEVIPTDKKFADLASYSDFERKLADGKRLALIAKAGEIKLDAFSKPSQEDIDALFLPPPEQSGIEASDSAVNGQIIIDK